MPRADLDTSRRLEQALDDLDVRRSVSDDISIVIPTLGRPILQQCLKEIVRGSIWPWQVIIVDQGGQEEIAGWTRILTDKGLHSIHVVSNETGRAAGLNAGLRRVVTPFVGITDDDCLVDGKWLENMRLLLLDNPNQVVSGRVLADGESDGVIEVKSISPVVYERPRFTFDALSGGNLGAAMHVFGSAGFFDDDPRLRTAEDAEWAYRMLRSGFSIRYSPELAVRHLAWRNPDERLLQYGDYARSHGGFYGKYMRRGDLFIAARAVIHHARALRRWIRGAMTGDTEMADMGRAYVIGLMPGILQGMKRTKPE